MSPAEAPPPKLVKRAADVLRRALDDSRPDTLADAAVLLIDLREATILDDGTPDWPGRSYAYRTTIGEVLSRAGITEPARRKTVRDALAYHTGNVLRERLNARDLADLGLLERSPRERGLEGHHERASIVATTRPDLDAVRALAAAVTLLAHVDPADLDRLPADGREAAERALADAENIARKLRRKLH